MGKSYKERPDKYRYQINKKKNKSHKSRPQFTDEPKHTQDYDRPDIITSGTIQEGI